MLLATYESEIDMNYIPHQQERTSGRREKQTIILLSF